MKKLLLCFMIPIYADVVVDNGIPVVGDDTGDRTESPVEDTNVVETENGPVRGYEMKDVEVVQYFDIPYGKFDARNPFQESKSAKAWVSVLKNEEHVSRCPQLKQDGTYIGTPECLTLSVFTPVKVKNADVLFHIHDGDFTAGSGNPDVYSPKQLVPEGIILVLPNYRIGPLGFMCWQNETVPGNAGLKDLVLALNWTKHNIASFGGNPSNIVVSGSGSGGALVDYLLIANESKAYISKAITESGFALSHWAIDRRSLRSTEVSTRLDRDLESVIRSFKNESFKPCIESDGGVIINSFWRSLQMQNITTPVMIGSANHAGMQTVLQLDERDVFQMNEDLSHLLPNDLALTPRDINEIGNRVKSQYFGQDNITINKMDELSLCFTDFGYLSPGVRQARALTRAGATVYFYEFSYTGDKKNPINGAAKGDSLHYVFSKDLSLIEHTGGANLIKDTVKTLWISFIKTGIPTAENVQWSAFGTTEGKEECLEIGSEIKLVDNLHSERIKLWDEIYDLHFIENSLGLKLKPPTHIVFINVLVTCNLVLSIL